MESEAYTAVYHFRDDQLFKEFIFKIPRSQLLEHLRNDEPLRRRCFHGFRISNTAPTCQQILNAYKIEIVDRRNGRLASLLCADWIRQQPALASSALQSLRIHAEDPANANSWIDDVHTTLRLQTWEVSIRTMVRELAFQFPNVDIHIFVSIISYGVNQKAMQTLVEEELLRVANDPQILKKRIEDERAAAVANRIRGQHSRARVGVDREIAMVFPQSMEITSDFGGTVCAAADMDKMHAASAANAIHRFRVSINC